MAKQSMTNRLREIGIDIIVLDYERNANTNAPTSVQDIDRPKRIDSITQLVRLGKGPYH